MFKILCVTNGKRITTFGDDYGCFFRSMNEAASFFCQKTSNFRYDYFAGGRNNLFLVSSDVGVMDCTDEFQFRKTQYPTLHSVYAWLSSGNELTVGSEINRRTYQIFKVA